MFNVPVQWSKGYDLYLTKSQVSTFPIVVIFFSSCVSEVTVLSNLVGCWILFSGKLGFIHYYPAVHNVSTRIYVITLRWYSLVGTLHRRNVITLSCFWIHWIYKMLVGYIASVCLRWHLPLTIICLVCVIRWPTCRLTIVMIFVLYFVIIIRSETWFISHCFGLGNESILCDARVTNF